jgi:hypothetical protein
VCGDCSKNKYLILTQSEEPVRVCNLCFESLSKNAKDGNKSYQGNIHNKEMF